MGNRQRKPKTDKHAVEAGLKPVGKNKSIVGAGLKPAPTMVQNPPPRHDK